MRVRPYQLRSGPAGTVEVRQVNVDCVLAREADGTMSVYDGPELFAQQFPTIVRRSPLEALNEGTGFAMPGEAR